MINETLVNSGEKIRAYISEQFDLRTLVYVYMAQNPGATQTSIAQKLGVSQVMLSRTLSDPKRGVRDEMIPGVIAMLNEIDVGRFENRWGGVKTTALAQRRYERAKTVVPLILSYINQYAESQFVFTYFELSDCSFLYTRSDKKYQWMLLEANSMVQMFDEAERLIRMQSFMRDIDNRVSFVCYDEQTFKELTTVSDSVSEYKLRSRFGNRYHSVFFVDLREKRVRSEYILSGLQLGVPIL